MIKAITVCVGYDDILRLTLPTILPHVDKLVIVTSPTDTKTQDLAAQYPEKVRVHLTDAFYRNGASFNKGLAMEEGFDVLGRDGWILILDADIVLPAHMPLGKLLIGKLYTPARRILPDIVGMTELPDIKVESLRPRKDHGNFGYFQLFHASDPVLRRRPWYGIDWVHAGGCDSVFEKRWHKADKLRMLFEVIHLGDPDKNWYGRATPRIDTGEKEPEADARAAKHAALRRKYGWGTSRTHEPVVERLSGTPAPETCHNHEGPQNAAAKARAGHRRQHVTPQQPTPPSDPPAAETPPAAEVKIPPLRKLPVVPHTRGFKNRKP